mmetsp:Transcript_16612/g.46904  ORF Transcript_16612/g.46904 Transcript_16612/m.46904 type:complete len:286 (+) Transcript_16612:706-1563(+)
MFCALLRECSLLATASSSAAFLPELGSPTTPSSRRATASRIELSSSALEATTEGSLFLMNRKANGTAAMNMATMQTTEIQTMRPYGQPLVVGPLSRIMKMMTKVWMEYSTGTPNRPLVRGLPPSLGRTMVWLVTSQARVQITPETTGEMTHDSMMPPRPPSIRQLRHSQDVATHVAPTLAPMMACVVLTGIQVKEASMRKMAAANSAENMATVYRPILELQNPQAKQLGASILAVPLMVFATTWPMLTAPANSMKPPSRHAHRRGMAPDPTLVPQELAASFAPMP